MAGYTKEEIEAQRRMDAMVEEYGRSNEQPPVDNFSADYFSKPETYEPFKMRGVESPAPSENRLPSSVRSQDMSRRKDITREYQDPSDDLLQNVPEGVTYPAPSLAPKELRKPGVTFMADRNPMDWKKGDGSDVERSQRYKVRTYLEQLYGDASKTGEIEKARKWSDNVNMAANVGYGLDRMFMAHSAARGGPGADAAFWEGKKKDGRREVDDAVQDRDQKIKNYLTKMKLGSEGVKEQQDMLDFDNKNKRRDPESDISIAYRSQFKGMFPEYADKFMAVDPNTGDEYNTLDTMTADEIEQAAKMVQAQAQNQISNSLKSSQIDLAKSKMGIDKDELLIKQQDADTRAAKAGIENVVVPSKDGAPAQTRTLPTAKGSKNGGENFDSDKRFIASAIKEKKARDEYERATKDAIKSYSDGGGYSFWDGYVPAIEMSGKNITGGKRAEYNAYVAKIATQVIDKVPGIRSDSDFRNLVVPMLPAPGDPKDVVKKKLEIFKGFLDARKPETTTYDMLSDKDKMRIDGKQTDGGSSAFKGRLIEQDGVTYEWNGSGYQEVKGAK